MRMFFIFIGLLYCIPCMGYIVSSETCDAYENDANACNAAPGCKYTTNGICTQCPPRSYCPGDGTQHACPEHYKDSFPGATSESDCYKATSNPNGGCYEPDGTPNPNCGLFYDGGTGIPKCWDTNGQYLTDYHTEGQDNLCYANTRNCNKFVPDVNNIQISGCQAYAQGEATWYNNKWNIMNCRYQVDDQQNNCLIQLSDGTHNVKCLGKAILGPNPQGNTNSPNANITSVDDSIVYDRISDAWPLSIPGSTSSRGYLCYGCPDGYYISEDDLQVMQGSGQDQEDLKYRECVRPWNYNQDHVYYNQDPVCNCTIAPKGYYTDSDTYGPCEFNYPFQFGNDRICLANKCPAGKTTDNPGATAASACHYTNDTQLCDNNGANCVSLSTLGIGWGDY